MPNDNLTKGFPRREFLKVGTLGIIAGALAPSTLWALPKEERTSRGVLLSIGYADVPTTESVRLQSAASMLAGDVAFISRGARLTFQSFSRSAKYRDSMAGGAAIDVVYPVRGYTDERLPRFRAWSFYGREEGDSVSGPTSFDVPVTATGGVELVVRKAQSDVSETADNTPRGRAVAGEAPASLTLGFDSSVSKLQRGAYVIAFRETDDDVVTRWDLFRLTRRGSDFVVPSAPFTYVVMTVDYAG